MSNGEHRSDADFAMDQDISMASPSHIDDDFGQGGEDQPQHESGPKSSGELPDQKIVRRLIQQTCADNTLDEKERNKILQHLTRFGTLPPAKDILQDVDDVMDFSNDEVQTVSYHDEARGIKGCKHYRRNVKLVADCCGKIFPCRFCHDENSDHNIIRSNTKEMFCMSCLRTVPADKQCICGEVAARYFCDKCKLWDDDPNKSIYHCDDCGICRQGRGLNQDFFHCRKCNICMTIAMKDNHRCIERNLESDCPICGEYMFTSTSTVIFMPCGHCIHKLCYTAYIQTSYQCPTCLKSLGDMSDYFERLDRELERQPMPKEYESCVSYIFCNDCEQKSRAKFHFFYHKCKHCKSYNTTILRTENKDEPAARATATHEDPNPSSSEMSSMAISGVPITTTSAATSSASNTDAPDDNMVASTDIGNDDQDFMQSSGGGTARNGLSAGRRVSPGSQNNDVS